MREKRGESQSVKVSCGFLESCNWICVFGFPLFLLFPSTTFLQTTLLSLHSTTTVHTLPHEDTGNAVSDNTLALFLFTTPHHHFTRPSLPSHEPRHSSSLLIHCVQPLPMVPQNDAMQLSLVLPFTHQMIRTTSAIATMMLANISVPRCFFFASSPFLTRAALFFRFARHQRE